MDKKNHKHLNERTNFEEYRTFLENYAGFSIKLNHTKALQASFAGFVTTIIIISLTY